MELVDIVTSVIIGALLGFGMVSLYVWFLYQKLKKQVDQMIEQVIAEAETNLIGLDIEVDNDTYFCYMLYVTCCVLYIQCVTIILELGTTFASFAPRDF